MTGPLLTPVLAWEIFTLLGVVVVAEVAFRLGRSHRERASEAERSQLAAMQAATLGLLGLLLAFTAAMAVERFHARRTIIVAEANAIATAYLRSQYLPEPHAAELAPLFREYVRTRVDFYDAFADLERGDRASARASALHREMWTHTTIVARAHGELDVVSAFVESMNDMIELEAARWVAVRSRIPQSILWLSFLVALVAAGATGYSCGLGGRRSVLSVTVVPVLVGLALCVVIDLDSPRVGFIRTGQDAMLRLQETLDAGTAQPGPNQVVSAS